MTDQTNLCHVCGSKGDFKCSACQQYACRHHWYYSNALLCSKCHEKPYSDHVCYVCGKEAIYRCRVCQQYACDHHWYFSSALQCSKCGETASDKFVEKAKEIIAGHSATLKRRKAQLLIYDDYGLPDSRKWNQEINSFLSKAVLPFTGGLLSRTGHVKLIQYVEEVATASTSKEQNQTQPELNNAPDLTPSEFEIHCADTLRGQGWQIRLTKSTGDQGIDIVAQRNGISLVIQCKLYSSPVGNKAVQEVHAGKDFLKADLGIVVSNTDFTPSAPRIGISTKHTPFAPQSIRRN